MAKVSVVQATPKLFDVTANLAVCEEWIKRCKDENDSGLILFPEVFLSGYPRGLSFGTVVGNRSEEGRNQWLEYHKAAITTDSPASKKLGSLARTFGTTLAIGVTEKDHLSETLYCSLFIYSPSGELINSHRKIKPTASERIIWGEGDGSSIKTVQTNVGTIGGLICWENMMPLPRFDLYSQGVQVYLAPTADNRLGWRESMKHIAREGRCFVLSSNQFVEKSDYPPHLLSEIEQMSDDFCMGGSIIVSPTGEIINGPLLGKEGCLHATIDMDELIRSRLDFDPAGHYHRPDIYQLRNLRK